MALDDQRMRILIFTDSHLGFKERDPIRGEDSFASFEEGLKQAKLRNCDFVLHAGDMFHENKPSRQTMHSAMKIFRENCFGEDDVYLEVMNSEHENIFKCNGGKVNFEDPFQSVSLPVFAIHGNHDDPSREGASGREALAALDLLSANNLINYYGKSDKVDDVVIEPVLMRKNGVNVALFGLGAIRDERLNRMWRQNKVQFVRPTDPVTGEEDKTYYNILVLHQNRDYGRGSKNCIHESMIPDWMDIVVWGNEHECKPQLEESLIGTYRIYQPGSSVATSLIQGESNERPKQYGILELRPIDPDDEEYTKKYRLKCHPFTQIRPFIYQDVRMADMGLNADDMGIEEATKKALRSQIQEMIERGKVEAGAVERGAVDLQLSHRVRDPSMVLCRLRVDHEGFVSLNQTRFGQYFVGRIANPADVLTFTKKSKYAQGMAAGGKSSSRQRAQADQSEGVEMEAIHKIHIKDLVEEQLRKSNRSLKLLPANDVNEALEEYVDKKAVNAITEAVRAVLKKTQQALFKDHTSGSSSGAVEEAAGRVKDSADAKSDKNKGKKDKDKDKDKGRDKEKSASGVGDMDMSDDDDEERGPKRDRAGSKKAAKAPAKKTAAAAKKSNAVKAKAKTKTKAKTAKGTGRGKKKYADSDEEDEDEEDAISDFDSEESSINDEDEDENGDGGSDMLDSEDEHPKRGGAKQQASAKGAKGASAKKQAATGTSAKGRGRAKAKESPPPKRAAPRRATTKAKKYSYAEEEEIDSDEDEMGLEDSNDDVDAKDNAEEEMGGFLTATATGKRKASSSIPSRTNEVIDLNSDNSAHSASEEEEEGLPSKYNKSNKSNKSKTATATKSKTGSCSGSGSGISSGGGNGNNGNSSGSGKEKKPKPNKQTDMSDVSISQAPLPTNYTPAYTADNTTTTTTTTTAAAAVTATSEGLGQGAGGTQGRRRKLPGTLSQTSLSFPPPPSSTGASRKGRGVIAEEEEWD